MTGPFAQCTSVLEENARIIISDRISILEHTAADGNTKAFYRIKIDDVEKDVDDSYFKMLKPYSIINGDGKELTSSFTPRPKDIIKVTNPVYCITSILPNMTGYEVRIKQYVDGQELGNDMVLTPQMILDFIPFRYERKNVKYLCRDYSTSNSHMCTCSSFANAWVKPINIMQAKSVVLVHCKEFKGAARLFYTYWKFRISIQPMSNDNKWTYMYDTTKNIKKRKKGVITYNCLYQECKKRKSYQSPNYLMNHWKLRESGIFRCFGLGF